MQISITALIFPAIILITGILTTITDLKRKKIYNDHLLIGAILGLAAIIYASLWLHENILFHLINGLVAFVIGLCFHRFSQWKGGDAKLFTLYAFLMPSLEPSHTLFSGAINLFACSFIAGMIILIPMVLKDIPSNDNNIINYFLGHLKRLEFVTYITTTILLSWTLFPVYYIARVVKFPVISLIITYLIFHVVHRYLKKALYLIFDLTYHHSKKYLKLNYNIIIGIGITFGFLMRLWLSPDSLRWPNLPYSILKIAMFSAFSAFIFIAYNFFKKYQERVPFAPLLFVGCILCYTPFLTWVMHLNQLIRR